MAKYVICPYCNVKFDREKNPFVQIVRRYAHVECHAEAESKKSQEQKDQEALENYIKKLFNETTINPRTRKLIQQYTTEYKYTYSGILKSLIYFYEVQGNSIEKSNGSIGIVPYVYDKAFQYYYALWLANESNKNKVASDYIVRSREVTIRPPQPKVRKRKLFSFLDKEDN